MPCFYFDVREGSRFVPDDEGLQFDGIDHAEREAAIAAAEIGRDKLPTGDSRAVTVEVRNEHRQRVLPQPRMALWPSAWLLTPALGEIMRQLRSDR